uniref:NADH-ubiquinone oxidoreductase chain 2 n=1 Tax=Crassadoma gigantea TaxID=50415 RepID=A0A4D6J553_CRAGA|nr:NADH dehydrogenase subunit 2 [Crassadoma gigantea]
MRNLSYSLCLILSSILFSLVSPGWLGVWVGLEMNMFGALVFMVNNKKKTATSGFKYFFIQAFGSSVVMMSIVSGSWVANDAIVSGLICGMSIKVGAVPFHFWVVEVLDGMRPGCMWFVLTVQKLVPFCCICQSFHAGWLLFFLSGGSALVGSICGVGSTRVSRFVGYSSVAHTGWTLASCCGGLLVLAYYLLAYWISLGGFLWLMGGDGYLYSAGGGKARRAPCSMGVTTWLLSLGGFPPFPGFCTKFVVFMHVLDWSLTLAFVLVISSVISWAYYLFVSSISIVRGGQSAKPDGSDNSMFIPLLLMFPFIDYMSVLY